MAAILNAAPAMRTAYMDVLTCQVEVAFSRRLGDRCREHGVQYIGHMIEDGGQHCSNLLPKMGFVKGDFTQKDEIP